MYSVDVNAYKGFSLVKNITLFLLLLSILIIEAHSKTLVMASDEWCPYVCKDKERPGFLVEIMTKVALRNNIDLIFSFIPLARALEMTKVGKLDMVLAITPQHLFEYKLQQSKLSFGGLYNDFYILSDNKWRYSDSNELITALKKNKILGVINGYEYGDKLTQLIASNKAYIHTSSGDSPLSKLLKMLQAGRVDIILDSRFTIQYELSKHSQSNILYAGTEGSFTPLYLGFSPKLHENIIKLFDNGLVKLRNNGELAKILEKYGLDDWEH